MEPIMDLDAAIKTVSPMWKMFHNPIVTLFKDLNNATNDLENLLSTFLNFQNSFTDIFIPRFGVNLDLKPEECQELDNKYFSFAMWFQGRLFYLLSCERLKRIHELAIKAQLKILSLVSVHPALYQVMCREYVLILKSLTPENEKELSGKVLVRFLTTNVEIMDDFELNPIFVDVSASNSLSLLSYTISILVETLNQEVDISTETNHFVRDTWESLLATLSTADVTIKVQVMNAYSQLLSFRMDQLAVNSFIDTNLITFLSLLKTIVYQIDEHINIGENRELNLALGNVIRRIAECTIEDTEINLLIATVCHFIFMNSKFDLPLKHLCSNCLRKLLKSHPYTVAIVHVPHKNIFTDIFIKDNLVHPVLELQIKKELEMYFENPVPSRRANKIVNVYEISDTCRLFSNSVVKYADFEFGTHKLNLVENIFTYIRKLNIDLNTSVIIGEKYEFVYFSDETLDHLVEKLLNFVKQSSFIENNHLISLINIFHYITLQNNYKNDEMIFENTPIVESLACFIALPFLSDLDWQIDDKMLYDKCKSIATYTNFDNQFVQKCLRYFTETTVHCPSFTNLPTWLIQLLNQISQKTCDDEIFVELLDCCPLIVAAGLTQSNCIISNWLFPIFRSTDDAVLEKLSEILSTIVCVLGMNYVVLEAYVAEVPQFHIRIQCAVCAKMKTNNFKMKSDQCCGLNFFQPLKRADSSESLSTVVLAFFAELLARTERSSSTRIIINVLDVLVAFSTHFPGFHSRNITEKWIAFAVHDEYVVRKRFANIFQLLLKSSQQNDQLDIEIKEAIFDDCQRKILKISKECIGSATPRLQETTATLVREFGALNINNSFLLSLKLLIHFAGNVKSTSGDYACICIEDLVVGALQTTEESIYIKYKKDICRTIVDLIVYNTSVSGTKFSSALQKLVVKFGFVDINDFIAQDGRHLLPYLIPWLVKVPATKSVLQFIADRASLEPSDLLINQFGNIYPLIYLTEDKIVYDECIAYILQVTKLKEKALKRKHFRVIHNELLLYYHEYPERVKEGLKSLFRDYDPKLSRTVQLVQLMQPRFLGVLVYFDSRLVSKRVAFSVKRRAMRSLPEIIKLMGAEHITPLRFKVLATLHTTLTLESKEFKLLSCAAWDAFVRNCSIDAIGSLLSTIFISLMPLSAVFPDVINKIFKFLIIEHRQELLPYLSDLFFLTETNVCAEIKDVITQRMSEQSWTSFRDKLQFYVKYLNHETMELRVHAVKFVERIMKTNRHKLNELILGNSGLDPVIINLLDLLIKGLRENEYNLQLACSSCIGELGAIEPSNLPRSYTKLDNTFPFLISEEAFVINSLNELIRAFQSEKYTQNMDCFALAIQEMLKLHNVSPDSLGTLWEKFPEHQQQIMQPFLSSRYKIAYHSEHQSCHPIFQSNEVTSHKDWIHSWISKLVSFVKNEKSRTLFDVCRPSLRKDSRLLLFFLPYLILHALFESDGNDVDLVYEEMVAVLTAYKHQNTSVTAKPLKLDILRYIPSVPTFEQVTINEASRTIYLLLDFLNRWQWEYPNSRKSKTDEGSVAYQMVKRFLQKFCKLMVAQSNYNCDEYFRALIYLEDYVSEHPQELENQLGFFTRIYVQLEDPDGVSGIRAIQQSEPSLEEMILGHEIQGQLQDAAACYERLAQEKSLEPHILQGLIRCYLDLDNPFTACRISEGLIMKSPEYCNILNECEAETLWRLGQFDNLSNLLQRPEIKKNNSWGVRLGHVLLNFRNGARDLFFEELSTTRYSLASHFSASNREQGLYEHGYSQIMKLHILNELQKVENMVRRILKSDTNIEDCKIMVDQLVTELDQRRQIVQSNVRILEPMFSLRRIAFQQAQFLMEGHRDDVRHLFDPHIGNYWLKSAHVARSLGLYQQAYIYLLNAEQYKPVGLFVDRAKLHWARGEQETAFNILKRGIDEQQNNSGSADYKYHKKISAEAKLLVASYSEETANLDAEANIAKYKEAIDCNKECEISMVYLARYYDKAHATMTGDKDIGLGGDMQLHIINYFGKSLQYGTEFIYQSMPRMLSIWVEYGTRHSEIKVKDKSFEAKTLNIQKMTRLISSYLERLPAYIFFSAFSQIVSRICHPHKLIYNELKSIIVKLILSYPQQSLWMLLPVLKSSYPVRMKRCQEILCDERIKNVAGMMELINDLNRLAEKLIELCNKDISANVTTTVSNLVRSLPRLFAMKEFSQIMMPVQQFRKMVIPSDAAAPLNHNPFPRRLVYITGIEETITIMPSLQKPKRISLLGSDGQPYMLMLKPKDDLRKDFRLMEFNDVVNHYLHLEPESRQRRLHIRTYSVVPLNEQCGIIEWIHNCVAFRQVVMNIYKQKGIDVTAKELRNLICNIRDSPARKRQVYLEDLLPRHPPVFHEWFRHKFPEPYAWYQARTAYIRTTAVMSIVGYIVGLGDRHGENILFDSTNGDTLHVDFNCLFNRGQTLEWPERVPFRLTRNMVKAMGPLGVEGTYRRCCEITLRVLRNQKETLMSIVKPFVYDPLVSWHKRTPGDVDFGSERTNEEARTHVNNIESRLQGMKGGAKLSICLSVEGHVNSLISDATSVDNLSQMYVGWGPYL